MNVKLKQKALTAVTILIIVALGVAGVWIAFKDQINPAPATLSPADSASDQYVEGFHDARTGRPIDDMLDVMGPEEKTRWACLVVEYSTSCAYCHEYVDEIILAWEALEQEYPGKLVVALVNVDQSSDKDILKFAAQHDVPDEFVLLGGVDASYGAGGVPETFIFARDPKEGDPERAWGGIGNFKGKRTADQLLAAFLPSFKNVEKYLDEP